MFLTTAERDHFDRVLERVLMHLPETARQLIDEVPLIVEDQPDDETMRQMRVAEPQELCGVYAAGDDDGGAEEIVLYRLGLWCAARAPNGTVADAALVQEIRLTLAEQLGGLFKLSEEARRKIAGI
jgi:predicted Zn-dependent protease with MMP-like domain